jgi:hypothetical protein
MENLQRWLEWAAKGSRMVEVGFYLPPTCNSARIDLSEEDRPVMWAAALEAGVLEKVRPHVWASGFGGWDEDEVEQEDGVWYRQDTVEQEDGVWYRQDTGDPVDADEVIWHYRVTDKGAGLIRTIQRRRAWSAEPTPGPWWGDVDGVVTPVVVVEDGRVVNQRTLEPVQPRAYHAWQMQAPVLP